MHFPRRRAALKLSARGRGEVGPEPRPSRLAKPAWGAHREAWGRAPPTRLPDPWKPSPTPCDPGRLGSANPPAIPAAPGEELGPFGASRRPGRGQGQFSAPLPAFWAQGGPAGPRTAGRRPGWTPAS